MSKLLIPAMCALLALPTISVADDHDQGRGSRPPTNQHDRGHAPPPHYRGGDHDRDRGYHRDYDRGNRHYGYGGRYPYPVYGYHGRPSYPTYGGGGRYPYYGGGGRHNGGDNDDALWAIGGLVLGAVIMHAVDNANAAQTGSRPSSSSAPPPRRVQTCYDDIVYDSDGSPRIERRCEEGERR